MDREQAACVARHRSTCSSIGNDFAFQSCICSARGSISSDEAPMDASELLAYADSVKSTSCADGSDKVITLCVGGTNFTTTLGTLTAEPTSYLATLFGSSRWTPSVFVPGSASVPFIDRDPESFRHVLAYLRYLRHADSQLVLPESPQQLKQLKAEADFYNLPGLAKACSLGRWASTSLVLDHHHHLHQQPANGTTNSNGSGSMYREPTFSLLQQQQQQLEAGGGGAANWGSGGSMQAVRDQVRHASQRGLSSASATEAPAGHTANGATGDGSAPISGDDVQISLQQLNLAQFPQQQQQQQLPCLAQCVLTAQQLLAAQQQSWTAQPQWQQLADLMLNHLLHLPLQAQQPDLVAALANPKPCVHLELSLQYYPVGDVRIELECRVVPEGAASTAAIAAAGAGAGAAAAGVSSSPHPSPREHNGRAGGTTGSGAGSRSASPAPPGEAATAAAVAARLAASGSAAAAAAGVAPGPGWGGVTLYHKFSIRETPEKFILTTQMPGEAQHVEEAARAAFKHQLNKYSTLHKLLVQQAPRASVTGLMWLLEGAGFSSVKLSTLLDTYYVAGNSFPGFKSIATFEL